MSLSERGVHVTRMVGGCINGSGRWSPHSPIECGPARPSPCCAARRLSALAQRFLPIHVLLQRNKMFMEQLQVCNW